MGPFLGSVTLVIGLAAAAARQPALEPQQTSDNAQSPATTDQGAVQVNWLYGAYLPKDVPLLPLSGSERRQLWLRQTFLTAGIYAKTAFFAVADEVRNTPPEWDGGFSGYGKRLASRYGQFAIQNSLSALGNAALHYEPRYERCRCDATGARIRHALVRNFVTYDRSELNRRPQVAMYLAALGAGLIASTWRPAADDAWDEAERAIVTQVAFGSFANVVGEFAPEIKRLLTRTPRSTSP